MNSHKFLFRETLECLLKRAVIEKRYWLLTTQSSRTCFNKCFSSRNRNTSEVIREHAFVPD